MAINLFGFDQTSPRPENSTQSLFDHTKLVIKLCSKCQYPIHIVGYSCGGSVGLLVSSILRHQVERLVLIEPNPFYLLNQHGRIEAYNECLELCEHIKNFGAKGEWTKVAEKFADYFFGDHSWTKMSKKRRQAFATSLPPNFHDWDAVLYEETTINVLKALEAKTLVLSGSNTRRIFREIGELVTEECPHWTFTEIADAGHMAPFSHPDQINKVIIEILDAPT